MSATTPRQFAILVLGNEVAKSAKRHVELNPSMYDSVRDLDKTKMRQFIAEAAQPECTPHLQDYLTDCEDRGQWTRLENAVLREAAKNLFVGLGRWAA